MKMNVISVIVILYMTCSISAKPVKNDIFDVLFKFKPKYYSIKDYLDILKLTVTLLDRNNDQSLHYNMQKAKEGIKSALTKPKRDCKELYDFGVKKDGLYTISPTGKTSFDAYCDMTNGGWTVIQRRKYGDVIFDRTWTTYTEGFGDLKGDHWLGLRHLHDLTKNHPSQISFRFLMTKTHANATAVYNGFYIDDEATKFRMHVKPNAIYNTEMKKYVDSKHNFFYYHNNMKFSTKDADHDTYSGNCAKVNGGGYWYKNCLTAKPNTEFSKMAIWSSKTSYQPVSRSEIKIRRMK